MPIWLKNFQRSVIFNESLFKMHCCFLLNTFRAAPFDTSVVCVTSNRMRQLNRTYRNIDTPTDILSFPYHEGIVAGELPLPDRECDYNLGDILISMPYVREQCEEEGIQLMERLTVLVTHGLSHLLGYTHNTEDETRLMVAKETAILTCYNHAFGTKLKPLTSLQ